MAPSTSTAIPAALTALLLLSPPALAATLVASHFTGNLYSLALSDSRDLTVDHEIPSGNFWPSWLDYDPESATLYVPDGSDWSPPNGLTTFSVAADGSLTQGDGDDQTVTQGGETHISRFGGEDGSGFIGFAHYGGSQLTTYALPITGASTPLQSFDYSDLPTGPNEDRQDASHPHGFHVDPTGSFALVPDLGTDRIYIYAIDAATGTLTECPAVEASPGNGPRHAAFWSPSPSGNGSRGIADGDPAPDSVTVVLVVNELANSLTAYSATRDGDGDDSCLSLSEITTLPTLPEDVTPPPGAKAAEVRVKDNNVYVSNRFEEHLGAEQDSLATFDIGLSGVGDGNDDGALGQVQLTFVEATNSHAYFPRTFDVNAAGDLVAVGGQTSSNVVIIERDVTTGRLGGVVAEVQVGEPGTPNDEDGLSAVIWIE